MKIVCGDVSLPVQGIYSEHLYEAGSVRPVLRMRLSELPTQAQLDVLRGNPITVCDEDDNVLAVHEGFDTVKECALALVAPSDSEMELAALRTQLEDANGRAAAYQETLIGVMDKLPEEDRQLVEQALGLPTIEEDA